MDCVPVEYVTFDNGTEVVVEQVLYSQGSDYTFIVVRDEDGYPRSLLLDNIVIVRSEWKCP